MNKTVNANIGGIVFTIDEDAYQNLHRYLDKLRKYFKQTNVSTDIIEDIEARIAEILQSRLDGKRSIVNAQDVDAVIEVMGKPEDFEDVGAEEEAKQRTSSSGETIYMGKRFFRNPDDRVVGGVASGLGAYFNVDPVWFRILFALSIIFWGTGVLIYIILWIILPEANTTTEKMQMRGEPINISNIEKSVREQIDEMGQRVKGFAKENFTDNERVKQASDSLRNGASSINSGLTQVLRFIGKLIGIFAIIIGLIILGSLLLAIFTTGTAFSISLPFLNDVIFSSSSQALLLSSGVILVTIVPIIWFITSVVLALLKVKQNRRWVHLGFLGVFLVSLGLTISGGIWLGTDFRTNGVVSEKRVLDEYTGDSLMISLSNDDHLWEHEGHFIVRGEEELHIQYSGMNMNLDSLHFTDIEVRTIPGTDSVFVISTYYYARGSHGMEARNRARDITYNYELVGNQLLLDPVFQIGDHPWRNQHVRLLVRVPEGKAAIIDPELEEYEDMHHNWNWE